MRDPDDFFDTEPTYQLEKQEPYIEQATKSIEEFFSRRKTPFHFGQLKVLFETQFFHITTTQAIYRLKDRGILKTHQLHAGANDVTFVFPAHLLKSTDTTKTLFTHMKSKAKIISLYDSPEISKNLADHFEALVKSELRANNLKIISTHSNEYNGKKFHASKANLDFIAEHPSGTAFGVQVKNELKSIEKYELEVQLSICSDLQLRPVFIVRYMPFSFVHLIKQKQGLLLVIGNQLWPLGYKHLCDQIRSKMSISPTMVSGKLNKLAPKLRTAWPIEVRTDIPEVPAKHLNYWITTGKYPERSSSN